MKVELIYYTPDYHKLVEAVARNCYQSYGKVNEGSHKFVRSIMKKGHLSIASVGNIVFRISNFEDINDEVRCYKELMVFKEINNMLRWTGVANKDDSIIVSMNLLTFLDIYNGISSSRYKNYSIIQGLFAKMLTKFLEVDCLAYFIVDDQELEDSENRHLAYNPELYNPVMMAEDYTALSELGLTKHELDIHATMTVNFTTDRSVGLQLWRHSNMTGGTELSQRYVSRSEAKYRIPEFCPPTEHGEIDRHISDAVEKYGEITKSLIEEGFNHGRAKEVARSILPNAMHTEIIQCRPLRQWNNLFDLRISPHAQVECKRDVEAISELFKSFNIPTSK